MKPIIISYPRSGKSYLQMILTLAFGKQFDFSHLNKAEQVDKLINYNHLITIVRNPIDSISSIVAMELEFNKNLEMDKLINNRILEYINLYSFSLKNADTFINFKDIVDNPTKVIKHISVVTNYTILNNEPKDFIVDRPVQNFLKSSKKTKKYKATVLAVRKKNLDECINLYQKALERCVKIDAL